MITSKKKKNKTSPKNSIQFMISDSPETIYQEKSIFAFELSLEEKKQEARKPLFIKRI
jgi:hypothetical protein